MANRFVAVLSSEKDNIDQHLVAMAPIQEKNDTIEPHSNDDTKKAEINRNIFTNPAFVSDELSKIDSLHYTEAHDATETQPRRLDFDDILPHIGEFGTYQRILFFLMIPFAFFVAFVYFTQIFITIVPERHWCRITELQHLTAQQR